MFLSPDANGSYKYNEQQDAVNSAQVDPCENHKPPVTPPVGGMWVNWIAEGTHPLNTFPATEIDSINNLRSDIFASARRHCTPKTNMDENAFAALMTAILHVEGKLPGNGNTPAVQEENKKKDEAAFWYGANVSTGIAKIKPSVAVQILRGEIPKMTEQWCYTIEGRDPIAEAVIRFGPSACDGPWEKCWDPRFWRAAAELSNPKISLEYLAANLERGADRINLLGAQASVFNLAAWHNRGAQTPEEFRRSLDAQSYGNVILSLMPTAFRVLNVQGRYLPYNAVEQEFVDARLRRPR